MRIIVATHGNIYGRNDYIFKYINTSNYLPLNFISCAPKDSNISHIPNLAWAELRAFKYGLKNYPSSYVGLFHYRRYLGLKSQINYETMSLEVLNKFKIKLAANLFSTKKLVNLPEYIDFADNNQSIYAQFIFSHPHLERIFDLLMKEFNEFFPAERDTLSCAQFMQETSLFRPANLYFGPAEFYITYIKYLEIIIMNICRRNYLPEFDDRWIGFISERLFNYYCYRVIRRDSLNIITRPVIMIQNSEN